MGVSGRSSTSPGTAGATTKSAAIAVAARWIASRRRLEMKGVADELGISRVTLFRNVGTREELLSEALWVLTEQTLALAGRCWETLEIKTFGKERDGRRLERFV